MGKPRCLPEFQQFAGGVRRDLIIRMTAVLHQQEFCLLDLPLFDQPVCQCAAHFNSLRPTAIGVEKCLQCEDGALFQGSLLIIRDLCIQGFTVVEICFRSHFFHQTSNQAFGGDQVIGVSRHCQWLLDFNFLKFLGNFHQCLVVFLLKEVLGFT